MATILLYVLNILSSSAMTATVWLAAWLYMIYDSPAKHPRISPEERNYIEESLNEMDVKVSCSYVYQWCYVTSAVPRHMLKSTKEGYVRRKQNFIFKL